MAEANTSGFSLRAFGFGLLVVLTLYSAAFVYAFLARDHSLQRLQSGLDTQTVLIDDAQRFAQAPEEETEAEASTLTTPSDTEKSAPMAAEPLPPAPVLALCQQTPYGLMPIAKSATETPFNAYKKPFVLEDGKKNLAITMLDFGLSETLSDKMIAALPSSVSLILSPYSSNPKKWTQKARENGHEVWLQIPVENKNFPDEDPGAKGLLTYVSLPYNQERFSWLLARTTGYAGIAAFTDSTLGNAEAIFKEVGFDIFKRGLGYVELNAGYDSYFLPLADKANAPHAQSTAHIDIVKSDNPVLDQTLLKLETRGRDVVAVSASERNIAGIQSWIQSLHNRGIDIVPVSAIAAMNAEH